MKPTKTKKVKIFAYAPRLIALLKRPGGLTVEQATVAANANLQTIRGQSLAELDKVITRIVDLRETLRVEPSPAHIDSLYTLAGTVIGIAGAFGLTDVQAAAASLCELIDELELQKRTNFKAIDVHLQGLKMLSMSGAAVSPQDTAAVLSGLAEVVGAVAAGRA